MSSFFLLRQPILFYPVFNYTIDIETDNKAGSGQQRRWKIRQNNWLVIPHLFSFKSSTYDTTYLFGGHGLPGGGMQ
jgi:hypothetical protein